MATLKRSRRQFLRTTTTAAGALALGVGPLAPYLEAQPAQPLVRRNIGPLAADSDILRGYRTAITAMKALPATDPRNWIYQANIHGTTDAGDRIAWNTCQHGTYYFFPWHRMYLYFFERIVRKYSGVANWTLPFWDYTDTRYRSLPAPFRTPTTNNALYVQQRNTRINGGSPLDASAVNTSNALRVIPFTGPQGTADNFGSQTVPGPTHFLRPHGALESTPHDTVHGSIGGLMGNPLTAARDPIFWVHHANIDRLWHVWLTMKGGRLDPVDIATWRTPRFTLFDENARQVTMSVCDVLNAQAQLGYVYEGAPAEVAQNCPRPGGPQGALAAGTQPARPMKTLVARETPTVLGSRPLSVALPLGGNGHGLMLDAARATDKDVHLQIEKVDVTAVPDVAYYEVYVGLPEGAQPDPEGPYFVGNLSFFGPEGRHPEHATTSDVFAAFRADKAVQAALERTGAAGAPLRVTFVPRGGDPVPPRQGVAERTPVRIGTMRFVQR